MALDRATVSQDIALSGSLYYVVIVQFFDSAAPNTVLWTETFTLPRPATTAQLQAAVTTRGQELRAALADLAAARTAVPSGTTVTIP